MYFGNYDNKCNYIGFYTKDIHGDKIPAPNIELNEKQWQEALTGDYKVIKGKHTYAPTQPTTEELRQQALNVIYEARQKAFNDTQWIFMRQVTGTAEQKLTDEEYQKYIDYWAEWRNFPETCENVFNPIYPILK